VVGTATIGAIPAALARVHQSPMSSKVPDRAGLAGHEGNHLAEVKARAAAECDHAVMAAIAVDLQACFQVVLVGVWVDFG
jgi:hypothetical protein